MSDFNIVKYEELVNYSLEKLKDVSIINPILLEEMIRLNRKELVELGIIKDR